MNARPPFLARLGIWIHDMCVSEDQAAGCWIRGWPYVWFAGEPPDPDETISSWVGRHAAASESWALTSQAVIDAVFGAGHCRRSIGS